MANQTLYRQEITFATLEVLENNTKILPNFYRDLEQEFGKKGAKIGDTIYVRKPPRAIGCDGAAYQPEPMVDTQVPITINQQSGVHFEFSTQEKFLNIDDMKNRYLDKFSIALANKLDFRCATMAIQNTAQLVGTPGTNPSLSGTDAFLTFLTANQRLDEMGFKIGGSRCMIIPPAFNTSFADFAKGNFNPQPDISRLWEKGQVSNLFNDK